MVSLTFLEGFLKRLPKLEIVQIEEVLLRVKNDIGLFWEIFNALPDSVIALKKDGTPIFYNQQAIHFFSLKDHKNYNFHVINVYPDLLQAIGEMMAQERESYQEKEVTIEGFYPRVFRVVVINFEILEKKERNHHLDLNYLILISDMTQQKKEMEKSQLHKNILSMDHLAAGLAHEIRNPLTSINLYIEIMQRTLQQLKQPVLQQELTQSLNVIKKEVLRLNDITSDFLQTIRPLSLNIKKVDVGEFIKYLVDVFKAEMQSKKIVFTIKEQENLPILMADIKYLKIIFFNLIKNAIDSFSSEKIGKNEITMTIEENTPFIEISIKDNGKGILQKDLDRIFEPYFTTKKNGVGIGLPLVYKIVSEHQGSIQIRSQQKDGTICSVFFPLYRGPIRKFLEKKSQ